MRNDGIENWNLSHRKIREYREDRDMSQRALAEELRKVNIFMCQQTISRIERNTRYVLDYELLGFCRVFGVKPSDLIELISFD